MPTQSELIEALKCAKEQFSTMTRCPLCSLDLLVRTIKKHFRTDHEMPRVSKVVVRMLDEDSLRIYRAFHNKMHRMNCLFCNESFERISDWIGHLVKTHKVLAYPATFGRLIDLQVKAIQEDIDSAPAPRRRILVQDTEGTAPL